MTLQEKYLPSFDFNEVHRIRINAPPDVIYQRGLTLNFSWSLPIRLLFRLRGIPVHNSGNQQTLFRMGFIPLEQQPSNQFILGLIGQFWKPSGNIQRLPPDQFTTFNADGYLKATWDFRILPGDNGINVLETETRIACLGPRAKRKFSAYWFFVKPFSGMIRLEMLKAIRASAEGRRQ